MPRYVFALGALFYALFITYGSTVIGPTGLNYVPLTWPEAEQAFRRRAMVWAATGSDQRADWMGNLLMLVPLGFLAAGIFWPAPHRRGARALLAALVALVLCCLFVVAVKFAQLFFPPRTVSLNYVTAQSAGAAIGILLFWLGWDRLALLVRGGVAHPRESLSVLLRIYTAALLVFMLMPLDFALSRQDLAAQIAQLGDMLTTIPGAGRPPLVQAVVLAAGTLALVPVGMMLAIGRLRGGGPSATPGGGGALRRSVGRATAIGFLMMLVVLGLTALLLSGTPSLLALFYRTAGIALGAALMHWLARQDPMAIRNLLAAAVPWLVLPYLLLALAVKDLLATRWETLEQAVATVNGRGLWPFYYWYIVTKAEAAKNIVANAVLYAPIGVMVWLRHGRPWQAGALALLLAVVIETGRFLRPGRQGDVNALMVAAGSAWFVAMLMPVAWLLLRAVTRQGGPVLVGWRARAAASRREA